MWLVYNDSCLTSHVQPILSDSGGDFCLSQTHTLVVYFLRGEIVIDVYIENKHLYIKN
jgi:hypothetical protein